MLKLFLALLAIGAVGFILWLLGAAYLAISGKRQW